MIFFEQIISGLVVGSIYSLLGLTVTMIFACTKRIIFCHGELMALGGFVGLVFIEIFPSCLFLSFVVGPLFIGLIAVIIERLFLRRLQEDKPLKIVIATIGLSVVLSIVMQIIWGADPKTYHNFISDKPFSFIGVKIIPQNLFIFLISISLMIILQYFFLYTKAGRALRALSQDRYAARLMGIKVGQNISLVYFLSGIQAGMAGMLVAPIYFVSSSIGTFLGLKGFIAAVIGGIGNVPGTIAGGFFLGIVESLSSGFISSKYKSGISLLFLVLVLLFSPKGLLSIFYKVNLLKWRKSKNEKY